VTEVAIDRTLDILRKQRRTFTQRTNADAAVADDRVTIDFEGKIDGETFEGGKAVGFQFILGEGRMLAEFEHAVLGMKTGESKTFPLKFPEDYHGKDVAGKEADFLVTLTKVEAQHLPEVDAEFAQTLGIPEATVDGLRADIKKNLEREVKFRVAARNKNSVMAAVEKAAEFDVPKALVDNEVERLVAGAREDLKQRGIKDADKAPIPEEMFRPQAERRVRLGLVVAELVRNNNLQGKPEQVRAHVEELAASYEKPADVVRWYYSDNRRLAEVEAIVIENNVTEFVLSQAKVVEKAASFDELMAQQG
jgi:trigger factor